MVASKSPTTMISDETALPDSADCVRDEPEPDNGVAHVRQFKDPGMTIFAGLREDVDGSGVGGLLSAIFRMGDERKIGLRVWWGESGGI